MPISPTAPSADLSRLVDEGFQVRLVSGHLVVEHVPYLNPDGNVCFGAIVEPLTYAGDLLQPPADHVVWFQGESPTGVDGVQLDLVNSAVQQEIFPGFPVNFMFSRKPANGYADHYSKMTAYVAMLMGPAKVKQPHVSANTFVKPVGVEDGSPFLYRESGSARAGIANLNARLRGQKVAIVGLGGTGSYILDFVAKTEVAEIHLFDADEFINHNAFRAPGAASIDAVASRPKKVNYFASVYSSMREGIIPHVAFLDGLAAEGQLGAMDFVFLAADHSKDVVEVAAMLRQLGIPFVDVGIGIQKVGEGLTGTVRTTLITSATPPAITISTEVAEDEYSANIQVGEVNALNAAMAVMRWKRYLGMYIDMSVEDQMLYSLSSNGIAKV